MKGLLEVLMFEALINGPIFKDSNELQVSKSSN